MQGPHSGTDVTSEQVIRSESRHQQGRLLDAMPDLPRSEVLPGSNRSGTSVQVLL
jgi:hypothetical protein